jgi:hypothetical protein
LCQPCSRAVFLWWQLAHLTSHFAISRSTAPHEYPCVSRSATPRALLPRTWSNWSTKGSVVPQSVHGWLRR